MTIIIITGYTFDAGYTFGAHCICEGKDDDVFRLCYGNYGNNEFFGNCQWNSLLHRFYALIFFFVKALRQWRQIREAMKQ